MSAHHIPALILLVLSVLPAARADEIRVAVASNFRPALEAIAYRFETQARHDVHIIAGATGKQYAQIVHGAPFEVFLAADVERPARLEADGRIVPNSRFTYAIGRLVLWSADSERVDAAGAVLTSGDFQRLAIANPRLAPYGKAARETLQALRLWDAIEARLVYGENIAQAYQFVYSGNAELGLVAASQVLPGSGSSWPVPAELHAPIEQQAVLLRETPASLAFVAFLAAPDTLRLIRQYGYDTP